MYDDEDPRGATLDAPSHASGVTLGDLPPVALDAPAGGAPEIAITGRLGVGGMGVVDLGHQTVFARAVAVKRVRPDRRSDEAVRALLQEARLTGALEHPNIVPAHLLGRSADGEPVLVMKRVEGVEWAELAADPDHPAWGARAGDRLDRHLEILVDVCNAAEFAHRRGVVHRDIKTDNVMVGDLGEVYLLDWGIAARMSDPPSGVTAGTLTYMAPEMLDGYEPLTARTDVYLLGATLHHLLTGETRHLPESLAWLALSIKRSQPARYDASVPAELGAICNRACARDPADRFPSALAFADAIREFQRHRGSTRLAEEAAARVVELGAALGAQDRDRRATIRRLVAECTFAFHLALRDWPDNAAARAGLGECLRLAFGFEIAERNAPGAEVVLGELAALSDPGSEPEPELAHALEALRAELRAEAEAQAALAELKRQSDVFLEGASGGAAPAVLGLVITTVVFTLSALGATLTPLGLVLWGLGFMTLVTVTLVANRRALMFNAASRRRTLATSMLVYMNFAVAVLGAAKGTPAASTLQIMAVCHSAGAAILGCAFSPILLTGVPLFLVVALLFELRPGDGYYGYGLYTLGQVVVNRIEALLARRAHRKPPAGEPS